MNWINPQLMMENALKNKQFKKVDDIYPPTEKDFDESLKYYNNLNEYKEQTADTNQYIKGKQELRPTGTMKPKVPETFYIPDNLPISQQTNNQNIQHVKPETFNFPNVFKTQNDNLSISQQANNQIQLSPIILKIIIVILILIIIYLYVKVETLKTKLDLKCKNCNNN